MTREELIEFIRENLVIKTRVSLDSGGTNLKVSVETDLVLCGETFSWSGDEAWAE